MPTLLTWNYVGVHCAEAGTEEPQRLYPGDIGLDDVFGEVVIKSMTGGSLVVEYSDGDEKVTKERTVGHIRAKEGRAQQRAAPATGRPRQARGGIHNFFGAAGGEASPQAVPKKQLAPNAKGLGRTVQQPATGKAPAAKKTTAAKQPAAAKTPTAIAKAAGKRKAGADADGQEEIPSPAPLPEQARRGRARRSSLPPLPTRLSTPAARVRPRQWSPASGVESN